MSDRQEYVLFSREQIRRKNQDVGFTAIFVGIALFAAALFAFVYYVAEVLDGLI